MNGRKTRRPPKINSAIENALPKYQTMALFERREIEVTREIADLIERFVSGQDTSILQANKIEVALHDSFPDDEYIQETVEMLAMYRPGGGAFLFDTEEIQRRLTETRAYLRG